MGKIIGNGAPCRACGGVADDVDEPGQLRFDYVTSCKRCGGSGREPVLEQPSLQLVESSGFNPSMR
jgi:hypothetical protein